MSESLQPPAAVNASQSTPTPKDRDTIFNTIYHYPWAEDSEFQTGFSSIVADTETNASSGPAHHSTDLLLQAQCFYFARKYNLPNPVDIAAYKTWMNTEKTDSHPAARPNQARTPSPTPTPNTDTEAEAAATLPQTDSSTSPNPNPNPDSSNPPAPPYPQSFASIIELITCNEPIPGIEEIPDTVLDASLSQPDQMPQRRKPWEKDEEVKEEEREEKDKT